MSIDSFEKKSVGVEFLDQENVKILSLIGEMKNLIRDEENYDKERAFQLLIGITEHIVQYTEKEELLMEICDYPHVDNHKLVHALIIRELTGFQQHMPYKYSAEMLAQLWSFFDNWWLDHVQDMDKYYHDWMKGKESLIKEANIQFETPII